MASRTSIFSEEERRFIVKLASLKHGKLLIRGLVEYYALNRAERRVFYANDLEKRFLRFEKANVERVSPILRKVTDSIRLQAEGCEPKTLRSEVERIIAGGQKIGR